MRDPPPSAFELLHACAQAALMKVSDTYGFHNRDQVLVKDLNSWAELQSGILRVHCTYLVRLWRKTPYRSKPLFTIAS